MQRCTWQLRSLSPYVVSLSVIFEYSASSHRHDRVAVPPGGCEMQDSGRLVGKPETGRPSRTTSGLPDIRQLSQGRERRKPSKSAVLTVFQPRVFAGAPKSSSFANCFRNADWLDRQPLAGNSHLE